jgi:hypothetical protein
MPIKVTITEWTIPSGTDCEFSNGTPCPFIRGFEYCGNPHCSIERTTPLKMSKRQTWKKTPLCLTRT